MSVFHDEVEIEDFEYDEESETYSYPCPCGDRFLITRVTRSSGLFSRGRPRGCARAAAAAAKDAPPFWCWAGCLSVRPLALKGAGPPSTRLGGSGVCSFPSSEEEFELGASSGALPVCPPSEVTVLKPGIWWLPWRTDRVVVVVAR